MSRGPVSERLMLVVLLGAVLLNYPFLSIFSRGGLLFGVPALYVYLFAAWALIIVLLFVVTRAASRRDQD